MAERARAVRYFEQFARDTRTESPLYSALSTSIVADDEVLGLVDEVMERQPPANVLFAAVHFLLLRGRRHHLGVYYPSVGGDAPPDGNETAAFVDFCGTYREELLPIMRTGRVQTNEVRRATFLVPAFRWIEDRTGGPLATIEVGTAAGLLTLWDLYRYDYGSAGVIGDSSLTLECSVRGTIGPLELPERAWSAGIDIQPIHVDDPDAADWLRALVWPNQVERLGRLEAAIDIARSHPPNLIAGDGIDLVPSVAAEAPEEATLVVHHSFALNQVSIEARARFERTLAELSSRRDVYLVEVASAGPDERPELRAGKAYASQVPTKTLARIHHHGEWIDWVA